METTIYHKGYIKTKKKYLELKKILGNCEHLSDQTDSKIKSNNFLSLKNKKKYQKGGDALEQGDNEEETADEKDEKEYEEDGDEECEFCHIKVIVDTIHIKDGPRLYVMYPNAQRPISEFKELIIQKLEQKDIELEGDLILSYKGDFLEDDRTVNYYRIKNGDLVLAIDEGATLDKPEYTEREQELDKYHNDPYYGPFRRVKRDRRTKLIVTPKDKKEKDEDEGRGD